MVQSSGALGSVCGLSGSSGCNVPPSQLRVWALREGAQSWILRHESRPYGAQQSRKLHNGRKPDEGIPSASTLVLAFLKRR